MKARCLRGMAFSWPTLAMIGLYLVFGVRGSQGQESTAHVLIEQFNNRAVFWPQFEIAKKIVALKDDRVLPELEKWLTYEDRHVRGNAAFIFAGLGDDRGFEVIHNILDDRSERSPGQGNPIGLPRKKHSA